MHGHVCIYLNKHDGWNLQMEVGHRMCDLYRSLVSKRSQVSTQLVLFCSMATPAHVFGQKVAALAKDWNAEQLDKLHGAREFCRNASLLMGLNAMLGYIYMFLAAAIIALSKIYSHLRTIFAFFAKSSHFWKSHSIYIYI